MTANKWQQLGNTSPNKNDYTIDYAGQNAEFMRVHAPHCDLHLPPRFSNILENP